MKRFFLPLFAAMMLFSAALAQDVYPDGIYWGFYYEGGIEQIAIEFELRDGLFASLDYHGVKYKDGDYMIEDASDAQKATLRQYRQLAQHLIGKNLEAIGDLYSPYDIVDDVDAVTTATMQSSKLISALWDGLNRRPYALTETSRLPQPDTCPDGIYRGCYMENGEEQVALELSIKDNAFVSAAFRTLRCEGVDYLAEDAPQDVRRIAEQFTALLQYLEGKPIAAINDLYLPDDIVPDADAFSGAPLRAPTVLSAIWDALSRRAYKLN